MCVCVNVYELCECVRVSTTLRECVCVRAHARVRRGQRCVRERKTERETVCECLSMCLSLSPDMRMRPTSQTWCTMFFTSSDPKPRESRA